MRILILTLALLLLPYAGAERVCSAHDGDTFKLCNGQSVRVWGIDAPELRQPLGIESRDHLRRLVVGKDVTLQCSGKSYQRQVCRVSVGGQDVEREMVEHGFAYDSRKYSHGSYAESEAFAQRRKLGVWALPDGGERPWDWRHKRR